MKTHTKSKPLSQNGSRLTKTCQMVRRRQNKSKQSCLVESCTLVVENTAESRIMHSGSKQDSRECLATGKQMWIDFCRAASKS